MAFALGKAGLKGCSNGLANQLIIRDGRTFGFVGRLGYFARTINRYSHHDTPLGSARIAGFGECPHQAAPLQSSIKLITPLGGKPTTGARCGLFGGLRRLGISGILGLIYSTCGLTKEGTLIHRAGLLRLASGLGRLLLCGHLGVGLRLGHLRTYLRLRFRLRQGDELHDNRLIVPFSPQIYAD